MERQLTEADLTRNVETECDESGRESPTSRMAGLRRWAATAVIVTYLGCLGHGVACHALQFRANSHPLMYFTVWDMFCGWSGWSFRTHIIAEGESGKYYALTPTPWGEYHPYSDLGREHYDSFHNHAWRIGVNCLRQTQHEPITQMFLVEETWSKKFNLRGPLWSRLHEEPPDPHHYFHVDAIYLPDGTLVSRNSTFHDRHRASWLAASLRGHSEPNEPRIRAATPLSN